MTEGDPGCQPAPWPCCCLKRCTWPLHVASACGLGSLTAWRLLLPESEAGQSWSPLRLPLGSRAASRLLHSSHQKQVTEAGCHSGRGDLGSAFNGTSVTVLAELLPSEHP